MFRLCLFLQSHQEEIEALPDVLTDKVVPEIPRRSRADNSCRKYELGFSRWKKWAESNGVGSRHILPAQVCFFFFFFFFALYLVSLIQTASTLSPAITVFYSIKWVHDISDMKSPTDSKIVINVLQLQSEFWQNLKIKKSQCLLKFL